MAVEHHPALPYHLPSTRHRSPGELPPVDEALLADETPYEMYDGRLSRVASANPPHAIRHTEVAFVLRANTAPGYISALDLKTRVDKRSEVAPDASIYRDGEDPKTAGRRLEELVVEVTGRQAFIVVTRKARKLAKRGVRRILCVRVKRAEVVEWDHAADAWGAPFGPGATVRDRCLLRPIAVAALLDAAVADNEAALGLLEKKPPAIVEALQQARDGGVAQGIAQGVAQGIAQGIAQGVLMVLDARAVPVSERARAAVLACTSVDALRQWMARAAEATSGDDLVGLSAPVERPKRAKKGL
jgi:hypothetical protein